MNMYNMVCSSDSHAVRLLGLLGFTPHSVPRYRDCYLTGDDPPRIAIYTRVGGGNRAHWSFSYNEGAGPLARVRGARRSMFSGGIRSI